MSDIGRKYVSIAFVVTADVKMLKGRTELCGEKSYYAYYLVYLFQ